MTDAEWFIVSIIAGPIVGTIIGNLFWYGVIRRVLK